jgi:hypothetical protein
VEAIPGIVLGLFLVIGTVDATLSTYFFEEIASFTF